jgi:hypothetical protein
MLQETKSTPVFSLQPPDANIKLYFGPAVLQEAAIISFRYTLTAPRRPKPSQEPEKSIYRALRTWGGSTVPQFVVVGETAVGAQIVSWDGKKSLQGTAPWGRPVVGMITGVNGDNSYAVDINPAALAKHYELLSLGSRQKPAIAAAQAVPEPEPVIVEAAPEPAAVPQAPLVEAPEEPYTGDPFIVTESGHFMDVEELKKPEAERFKVPKDFDEFYGRYPKYILNWVKKRLNKFTVDEDVEDWTQDLIIHLKYLPANSKHRLPGSNGRPEGCKDVIETFSPRQQYGASERRFRNYLNGCLANKFMTVQSKRQKNPVLRPNTVPFGGSVSAAEQAGAEAPDDEYIHANSSFLADATTRAQRQHENKLFTTQFIEYVFKTDPAVLPAVEAIGKTGTQGEAAQYMREILKIDVDEAGFARYRNRLKVLAECFLNPKLKVPKMRKPYKKRSDAAEQAE